jgi:hypothetical protein
MKSGGNYNDKKWDDNRSGDDNKNMNGDRI